MEYRSNIVLVVDERSDPRNLVMQTASDSNQSGAMVIDKAAYVVYLGGEKISFPKKEFELLLYLATNPRKVFKREEILSNIWGPDYRPKDSRSLDVHIRMLRKKLNDEFISTVRGVGYRLEK
jgi:two-component system alkaline phosphatase synthesis response regulator PhoP